MKRHRPQSRRSGFSLFEVLLALALLAGAMTAIGQLLDNGVQASLRNQLQTEGLFICESKLTEYLINTTPPPAASATDVPDAPGWKYSIATTTGPRADLIRVEVTAMHYTSDRTPRENMRVALVRLIRTPVQPPDSATTTLNLRLTPLKRGAA